MRRLFAPALIIAAAWWLWSQFAPISRPPGVLVRSEPEQMILTRAQDDIVLRGWKLKPLAHYKITARVLSKTCYANDPGGDICLYDLAVGWGPMSDSAVLDKLDVEQNFRRFCWSYAGEPPIPRQDIVSHACNMHLAPADDATRQQISRLRKGALVSLSGLLVEMTDPKDGGKWRSSLSRTDGGDGACEVMLVRSLVEHD